MPCIRSLYGSWHHWQCVNPSGLVRSHHGHRTNLPFGPRTAGRRRQGKAISGAGRRRGSSPKRFGPTVPPASNWTRAMIHPTTRIKYGRTHAPFRALSCQTTDGDRDQRDKRRQEEQQADGPVLPELLHKSRGRRRARSQKVHEGCCRCRMPRTRGGSSGRRSRGTDATERCSTTRFAGSTPRLTSLRATCAPMLSL